MNPSPQSVASSQRYFAVHRKYLYTLTRHKHFWQIIKSSIKSSELRKRHRKPGVCQSRATGVGDVVSGALLFAFPLSAISFVIFHPRAYRSTEFNISSPLPQAVISHRLSRTICSYTNLDSTKKRPFKASSHATDLHLYRNGFKNHQSRPQRTSGILFDSRSTRSYKTDLIP